MRIRLTSLLAAVLFFVCSVPAGAQMYQFGSLFYYTGGEEFGRVAPGAAGSCLLGTGTHTPPSFGSCAGVTFQANGTGLANQNTINFENSAPTNGLTIEFLNPSLGNLQIELVGLPTIVANECLGGNPAGTALIYLSCGGSGGMVYPAAGVACSTGSAWCTPYSASNPIPATSGGTGSATAPTSAQIPIGNSGGTSYAPQTVSGDCTLSNTGAVTCTRTSGTAFGTFATANAATPPAIGGTTSAAGSFTTLHATGQVTSTVTTGTAPLVVASTTEVANLQAATAAALATTPTQCSGTGSVATGIASSGNANCTTVTTTIASGSSAMGTSAIASAACATVVTTAATGVASTDSVSWSFNADPTSTTGYIPSTNGMLTIIVYPTAGDVNFKVCNNTSASVTPGAVTLNWRVVR